MLGSDMFSRFMGNRKLLNKKQYFQQHQGVNDIDIQKNRETLLTYKKASRKEILKIREEMTIEEKKELDRKVLLLLLSIILTVILISLIIYFIKYIPEDFLDFPSDKSNYTAKMLPFCNIPK
jgi:uncharacterized membrane protein YvbJ